ncbi:MAG: hypothetical protein AAF208_00990 [Cyanobacteria bacterium P01_A01_bin.45]
MIFTSTQPESPEDKWKHHLNKFVKANQQQLAALSWGLWLQNGSTQGSIGIDLQPHPHFVYCPQEEVEKLNDRVDNQLQEILGLANNHNPEVEVLMIGIGKGQIKLIYFQPEISPPECFETLGRDVNTLLTQLEEEMNKTIKL